jgi:hypothetical protein
VRGANIFNSHQTAIAWTLGYQWRPNTTWEVAFEALQIRGSIAFRERRGLEPHGNETALQLAVRYAM